VRSAERRIDQTASTLHSVQLRAGVTRIRMTASAASEPDLHPVQRAPGQKLTSAGFAISRLACLFSGLRARFSATKACASGRKLELQGRCARRKSTRASGVVAGGHLGCDMAGDGLRTGQLLPPCCGPHVEDSLVSPAVCSLAAKRPSPQLDCLLQRGTAEDADPGGHHSLYERRAAGAGAAPPAAASVPAVAATCRPHIAPPVVSTPCCTLHQFALLVG
jgi:hypothetical protein